MYVLSCFSHVNSVTPWGAQEVSLSMEFSRQKYWNGLPCPPPVDLPDPGIEPALTRGFFTTNATWEAHKYVCVHIYIYTHIKMCGRDFIWLVKPKIFIIWTFT